MPSTIWVPTSTLIIDNISVEINLQLQYLLPDACVDEVIDREGFVEVAVVVEAVETVELDTAADDVTDPGDDVAGLNVVVSGSGVEVIGCEVPF